MAKYALLLCILLNAWQGIAQTAYIAAPKGLKLRKTADANGVVVKTIPYGTTVRYLKDTKAKVPHKIKEADNFFLNGNWQKVIVGADSGYVFDAFLLPVMPVGKNEIESFYSDTTADECMPFIVHFLDTRFKADGKPYDIKKFEGEDSIYYGGSNPSSPYCQREYTQKFGNGTIVMTFGQGEGGSGMEATMKGYTLNQVYALALSTATRANYKVKVTYENGYINIGPEDDGAGCYSSIKVDGNIIKWGYGCGC